MPAESYVHPLSRILERCCSGSSSRAEQLCGMSGAAILVYVVEQSTSSPHTVFTLQSLPASLFPLLFHYVLDLDICLTINRVPVPSSFEIV